MACADPDDRAFATLRWGEVTALRRWDVAPDGSWVRVSVAYSEVAGRGLLLGPPKSKAGVRTLNVPEAIRPEVVKHLMNWVKSDDDALLFTGVKGNAIRKSNFAQRVKWTELVTKMGP